MANEKEIAIQVSEVSKTFKLPHEKQTSLKSLFLNLFKNKKYEFQKAVDNVSFKVNKGEFFGIVGRNGSGKSTLLKCIAGVYTPNKGAIQINGSLIPFIELGVGFNPELSGRDNVFLNGALLGFSRKKMESIYEQIVEFAELEQFMDQKLKNYSSGMQVRLAFSIAIRAQGDILLLDEVLAVGDAAFQTKCFDYFQQLKNSGATVIFVSHDRTSLERFCDRGILINEGSIVEQGSIRKILKSYSNIVLDELERGSDQERKKAKQLREKISREHAKIVHTVVYNRSQEIRKKFKLGEEITVKFSVQVLQTLENPVMGITLWQKNVEKPIFVTNTLIEGNKNTGIFKEGLHFDYSIKLPINLNDGEYYVEPAIANESTTVFYDQKPKATVFHVSGGENPYSILFSKELSSIEVIQK